MDNNNRWVYSTESGRHCPRCEKPLAKCRCSAGKGHGVTPAPPGDGIIRIRREVKGRKGKTVTSIIGVPLADAELKAFAKLLKRRCGTGGAVKNGVIYIQGDQRATLLPEIKKQGYPVKLAGG